MFARLLAASALCILLSTSAWGQSSKAYAPENLNRLDRDDQTRVLEREYEEQSRGSRLPDDQLEFYLDQIESGWNFSRIKQDIAESLRGGGYSGNRPGQRPRPNPYPRPDQHPGPVYGQTFHCESRRAYEYEECRTPFNGRAQLVRQTSRAACIEGRTWGSRHSLIWVNNGCAGDFSQVEQNSSPNYSVTCGSEDYKFAACAWRQQYGYPQLIEQISRAPCVQGRSWGYDRRRGLWVNRGCEARFGTRF